MSLYIMGWLKESFVGSESCFVVLVRDSISFPKNIDIRGGMVISRVNLLKIRIYREHITHSRNEGVILMLGPAGELARGLGD